MRTYPYLLVVALALLGACSDSTGPDLSPSGTPGTSTARAGKTTTPHLSAPPALAK